MTAEEIRKLVEQAGDIGDRGVMDCLKILLIGEIAAQLAEMNSFMRKCSFSTKQSSPSRF